MDHGPKEICRRTESFARNSAARFSTMHHPPTKNLHILLMLWGFGTSALGSVILKVILRGLYIPTGVV